MDTPEVVPAPPARTTCANSTSFPEQTAKPAGDAATYSATRAVVSPLIFGPAADRSPASSASAPSVVSSSA
ncbi:hypothetical protein OG943_25980 [Amycolatopsis sp. NBC_00345]|uniref:hypothetical protein n=1 Tax=Amycolatopsis sp. NBC_00345 TaxID=2975955 RepID=UPI002E2533BD